MKTRAAVVLIAVMAISATGCEEGRPPGPSAVERIAMWKSEASENARDDVEVTVAVRGTVVTVSAKNLSDRPLCTSESSWPDGEMLGDVFLVKSAGVYRLYEGDLASILGDDFITVIPGQTIRGQVDIALDYGLRPGAVIESVEFSPRFDDCPPKGEAE